MARTDNDTWDLASSVGATATMVAAQRVLAHREGLIDDPFAEPLVRAVGLEFFTQAIDGEIDLDSVDPEFNVRRAAEGMAVRTRHFDRLFTDAAAAGVRQAVILAAGLDARAYRLPWPAGTTVYEVDQPEVIEFKTATLAELGAQPAADRRTVAIDLREDWPEALRDNGFDPSAPTAWIAEGLLIYLPPEAQDLLFDRITALSAPGSRVATEHIPDITMFSDERSQRISDRMKKYGSKIEMGELIYHGERNDVLEYLIAHGWRPSAQSMREAYAANGFEFPEEETIGMFADMSYVSAVR
ncbi:class I SAM-dependent methyltransferase [Mycolicibacterium holsaticum]|uniref:class I SAM-dependent methyltransferase n=1 Tax=Mycolicibacterium holsaticum TaxID=152142 RepID=UPI001C7CAC68|nr:class I SAM-dependent methyltransferase [Mycolicibacterium holsaticum]MDA4109248.1 S-adenosyl-L-methionine-dependent methyltransferase [Mycolicibacterium holsaticum DSM 44478 = JCM 12374]QZA11642.1 class I SAM-dependent methyltransferase [Mycolicibacterium holsaticum DSM 44478 = JCM 12374]UNC10870.1 class I SAM-dependent methyltransferase [Mycolicibacterium holsaticum DSM 44478 = JCM 12374]